MDTSKKYLVTLSKNPEYTGEYDKVDEEAMIKWEKGHACNGVALLLLVEEGDGSISSESFLHDVSVRDIATMMNGIEAWERVAKVVYMASLLRG